MLIAIKENDTVIIGYTLREFYRNLTDSDCKERENIPVYFTKSGAVFAFSSPYYATDELAFDDDFTSIEITPSSIIGEVVPFVKEKYKNNEEVINKKGNWCNEMVIVKDGRIFGISTAFEVLEFENSVCFGKRERAVSALLDGTKGLSAKERMQKCINFVACL